MKKFTFLATIIVALFAFTTNLMGQTAGDLAIIAGNADNNDQFAFVALADIPANTTITFTDNAWTTADGPFAASEGYVEWVHTSILTAGTVVVITGVDFSGNWGAGSNATTGSITYSGIAFSASGDQIIAFKGAWADRPTNSGSDVKFLYAFSWENFITTGTTSSNTSYLPAALSGASTAMTTSATETDNAYFANGNTAQTSVTVSGTKSELLALFNDGLNLYYQNNAGPLTFPAYSITVSSGGNLTPPVLTADATNINVDNNLDITFTDNSAWRGAVTDVTIGGFSLGAGDYLLTAGNLQLIPSNGNTLLTTSGSKSVGVVATGYNNASVVQQINAGAVVAGNSSTSITPELSLNTASTVTCNAFDQYNNAVSGYTFKVDIQVIDNNATTNESFLVDGVAYTSTPSPVNLSTVTNASGVTTFGVTIPALVDQNDGLDIQVQTAAGANVGSDFYFTPTAPMAQITGSDPSSSNCLINSTNNVLYRASIQVVNDVTTLTALTAAAAGTYLAADLPANGFKLWFSTDNVFSAASDVQLTQLSSASAGSGETLSFTGFSQAFGIGTNYIFITADIDAAATTGRTISAALASNTNFTFTAGTTFSGSTYGAANLHNITGPPLVTELVIPQYFGGKTASTANAARTPFAMCIQIENLTALTNYDLKFLLGLTSEGATLYGAGNMWDGAAFSTNSVLNAFTTDASGNSGPVWVYFQPTGNGTRFGPGQQHNLRVGFVAAGGTMPTTPLFVGSKIMTALDIATTPLTAETTDDGAFIYGLSGAAYNGKYAIVYNNEAGTGDPMFAYQARQATATNTSQTQLPATINDVYTQAGSSVAGDFPAVVPIGVNNPNGVRRIEFRNADNTLIDAVTNATGDWGVGANTTAIVRREVMNINLGVPTSTLSVEPATLSGFTYPIDEPIASPSQYYTLSGTLLSGFTSVITITGSTNFEVSNDDSSWGPSTTVEFTSATLLATPVYVRLKAGLALGTYSSELIVNSGGGAAPVNVTVSGTVSPPLPTASCLSRPTHIDISDFTSQSAVLMKLKNYESDDARYRLYSGGFQYNPWDESIDAYITSSAYASGPLVPGTPSSTTTFWILFQRGGNNGVEATYRDKLGTAYSADHQTLSLPTANSITTPFALSGNFVPFGGYDNTIKHVVLAYSSSILVSATSTTQSTGAFALVCPVGTTIDLIEVRAIDNTLIASRTGNWSTTTYVGNVPDLPVVAPPVISPLTGNFYAPFNATITCNTPASSIYYTTNGSDPDNTGNGTLYTAPVPIGATTILKAKAYATDFDPSIVVSETYTFPVVNDVANIAALRAGLTDGTAYRLTGEAVLTFQTATRNAKYIQDATGAILIDDNTGKITTTYSIYDGITGITGTLSEFGNMLQFVPVTDPGAATSNSNTIIPEEIALTNLNTTHQAKLVKVLNTTIAGTSPFAVGVNYTLTDPSGNGVLRTQYSDLDYIGSSIPIEPQDLTGVILEYNTVMQLIPRSLDDFSVSTGPILTAQPNELSGFLYAAGNGPSPSQVYVLEGNNLAGYPGDITVSAAGTTGYEVSNDDITFGNSTTVPFTSSVLSPVNVYVRLKAGLASGAYDAEIISNNGGGVLLPVNVTVSGTVLAGEPTNHASGFTAESTISSAITLTWSDNDGAQPADGFLVLANTTGSFTAPVDGVQLSDDSNLGDGSGIMNVAHGVQTLTWGGLLPGTPYYFVIYPYTNAGLLIDYKTDPAAPTATATTLAAALPLAAWTFDLDVFPVAPNTPTSVAANYGSQLTAMLYADGTNGSSTWLQSGGSPEIASFGGTTLNDPRTTPIANNAIALANNSANGKSIVLKFSLAGYENPILTFATRGTGTGFNMHLWAWSTDNVTYTDFGTNTANTTSTFLLRTLDLGSIDDLDQAPEVYIRLTVSGATSSSGNNRIDNIVLDATPAEPSFKTLNVSVLLEGLYESGTGLMRQAQNETGPQFGTGIADQVSVELHEAIAPFGAAYTFNNVDLSTNGALSIGTIPAAISGSYYVVIKHRNSIETWSNAPVSFDGASPFNYDFTTSAFQAYGNNLMLVGTAYVIYGGDVSQDGGVDTSDMTEVDNNAAIYAVGYLTSDVNGDGGVDTSDMTIVDNNSANYVISAHP